jgi:hypothetical protein
MRRNVATAGCAVSFGVGRLDCDAAQHLAHRQMVSRGLFEEHFWRCHDALSAAATAEVGMPGYFRFITLLGEWGLMGQVAAGVSRASGAGGWGYCAARMEGCSRGVHGCSGAGSGLGFTAVQVLLATRLGAPIPS